MFMLGSCTRLTGLSRGPLNSGSACIRCTVRSFAPTRDQEGIVSARVRLRPSWQRRAQVRRRSWGARWPMPIRLAYRFTAYQTTSVVTPSPCRVPSFETRLNTLPSVTPVSWIQTSMRLYTTSVRGPFAGVRPSQPYRRSPSGFPSIAADPIVSSRFPSVADHIRATGRSVLHLFCRAWCFGKRHSIALAPDRQLANCQSSGQGA
jgi:hypothetical protein